MKKIKIPYWYLPVLPFLIYWTGAVLNVLVITANGGVMPVAGLNASEDEIHAVMTSASHLKFLADWIQLPGLGIASPGDMFLWLGAVLQTYFIGAWVALIWKEYHAVPIQSSTKISRSPSRKSRW